MSIYTTPSDFSNTGRGGVATGKMVVKIHTMYITLGSAEKILKSNNKIWYALPLYNGKRRRIGNLDDFFGESMNHGQVPGFVIYKVYTKDEIKEKNEVKESWSDYPLLFVHDNMKPLVDINNGGMTKQFVNKVIDDLIS